MSSLAEYVPLVTSQATLQALPSTLIPVNAVIKFVDSSTLAEVAWQIRSSGLGLLPLDYDTTSNNKSWFAV